MKPSIAVIIPVYNAARYIEKCIDSCLKQEALDEIIIIDDGSTDGSVDIIKSKVETDKRLRLFQHPDRQNHGRSASRNLGIQKSKTTWITFLDADDYFLENRFEAFLEREKTVVDGFYEAVRSEYEAEKFSKTVAALTEISAEVLPENLQNFLISNREQRFSIIGLIIKRDLCMAIQLFDKSLKIGEDTDFIWRASGQGNLIKLNLKEPRIIRSVHAKNTYQNQSKDMHHQMRYYEKWMALSKNLSLSIEAKKRIIDAHRYYQYKHAVHDKNYFRSLPIKLKYFWSKSIRSKTI